MTVSLVKLVLTATLGLAITLTLNACEDKEKKQTPAETPTAEQPAEAEAKADGEEAAEEECADICQGEEPAEVLKAMEAALAEVRAATKTVKAEEVVKGTFTDTRDNKTYKTVKIGEQVWLAENLNASGLKCYENKPDNRNIYGKLYDWETAMKACPKGWHLPSNAEWEVLTVAVGDMETAGKYLKSTSGWKFYGEKSGNGEDKFDFSALPGGYGNSDSGMHFVAGRSPSDALFDDVGTDGYWWSSSETSSNVAYYRNITYSGEYISYHYESKSLLFSVRCIQN